MRNELEKKISGKLIDNYISLINSKAVYVDFGINAIEGLKEIIIREIADKYRKKFNDINDMLVSIAYKLPFTKHSRTLALKFRIKKTK